MEKDRSHSPKWASHPTWKRLGRGRVWGWDGCERERRRVGGGGTSGNGTRVVAPLGFGGTGTPEIVCCWFWLVAAAPVLRERRTLGSGRAARTCAPAAPIQTCARVSKYALVAKVNRERPTFFERLCPSWFPRRILVQNLWVVS